MRKIKTRRYLKIQLDRMYNRGHGVSKKPIKGVHNNTPFIHSETTYRTYLQQCNRFADWAHKNGYTDPEVAKEHISDYVEVLKAEDKSAWTIYTALCAICKAYGLSTQDVGIEVPRRHKKDIKRSRERVENDRHISLENNSELITFCCCFGLRKEKELAVIKGTDFKKYNGKLYCEVVGKGGKPRTVPFVGSDAEQTVCLNLIKQARQGKLFPKLPSNIDIHYYRSVYACKAYRMLARPTEDVPPQKRYYCRGENKGKVYDKEALLKVSKALGHNRESVVVNNYLYNL